MGIPLRVLVLEDSKTDYEILLHELRRGGYEPESTRVETEADMKAALANESWEVIISDFSMPQFDSFDALKILKESGLDLPFIVLSGTIGEDVAVQIMKSGAHDYLMKDKLARLCPAVERELREARVRKERKRAENALRESEDKYKSLIENIQDIIFTIDLVGKVTFSSQSVKEILGYDSAETINMNILDFIPEEERRRAVETIPKGMKGEKISRYQTQAITKSGDRKFLELIFSRIYKDGAVVGAQAVAKDITAHKRAEEELKFRNVILSTQQETSIDGILIVNENGKMLSNNRQFVEMWGISDEVVDSRSDERALQSVLDKLTDPEEFARKVKHLYENHNEKSRDEISLKDGRTFDRYSAPMFGPDEKYYGRVWYFRDITRNRQLEEQLHQAMKMEAVGRLAGGVAHDFNNILVVILSYAGFIINELKENDPMRADAQQIKDAARRAAALTRQLLAFSRKETIKPEIINLNSIVTNLEKMLRRIIGEDLELSMVLDKNLGNVKADLGQIEQVLANLAVNARDAMMDGGKLLIETKNVQLDQEYSESHLFVAPGSYVMLAVSDTGSGMDADTLSKIFEPFFTTKELGKGTGLGLSTVYGIVKQNNGYILAYSEPGQGTSFKIYLPIIESSVVPVKKAKIPDDDLLQGTETILLVEDEDAVRKIAGRILRINGYTVIEASNGGEALLACENHDGTIHVLLTDVIMPRMSGKDLAERLNKIRPEIKVVYMSGYTNNAIAHQGVLDDGVNFVQKPFSEIDLLKMIRKALIDPL